jgi:plasmid stabilization system protein ParE
MRRRKIELQEDARKDLIAITLWLREVASRSVASRYVGRIRKRIMSLQYGGERGTIRDDVTRIRIIGIMPSVSIAFTVDEDAVIVHRILYRGQNMETDED